jgi:rhodanese-related sulfurtransferase
LGRAHVAAFHAPTLVHALAMRILRFWWLMLGLLAATAVVGDDDSGVRADSKPAFQSITVKEFEKMRTGTNVVILDVRTEKEFKAGHIPGAQLIDVNSPTFDKDAGKLDRSKVYLVHCAAGVRSLKACNTMRGLEFTNLYNLRGGYKGWVAEGHEGVK